MSRTAITLKFKMRWFPDEEGYSAEKVCTDINLPALMSNEDKNIGGSLILDLRKWWRHVQAKNSSTNGMAKGAFSVEHAISLKYLRKVLCFTVLTVSYLWGFRKLTTVFSNKTCTAHTVWQWFNCMRPVQTYGKRRFWCLVHTMAGEFGELDNGGFALKTHQMFSVHIVFEENSDRDYIVFEKLRFQNGFPPYGNTKAMFQIPPVWRAFCQKLRFHDGLMWTTSQNVEIIIII